MLAIKPDVMLSSAFSGAERDELSLNFSILKITNRIAAKGKDVASVFNSFDKNSDKSRKYISFNLCCSYLAGIVHLTQIES